MAGRRGRKMFSAGIFGTIEDMYYGGRNAVSSLFTKSSYCNGSNNESESDSISNDINVGGVRTYFGDFLANVAKKSMKEKVEALISTLNDDKSELREAINVSRETTSASDEEFEQVMVSIFTERFNDTEKEEFMKEWARFMNNTNAENPVPLSDKNDITMGGKIKMSDKLVEIFTKLSKGELDEEDAIKQLSSIDTTISLKLIDFIKEMGIPNEETKVNTDGSGKANNKKESMDLKSLLMETEIGQKLFEHV